MCHYDGCRKCNVSNKANSGITVPVRNDRGEVTNESIVLCPKAQKNFRIPCHGTKKENHSFYTYGNTGQKPVGSAFCSQACDRQYQDELKSKGNARKNQYRKQKSIPLEVAQSSSTKPQPSSYLKVAGTQPQTSSHTREADTKLLYGDPADAQYTSENNPFAGEDWPTEIYDPSEKATTKGIQNLSVTSTTALPYSVPGSRARGNETSGPRPAGPGNYDRDYRVPSGQSRQNLPSPPRTSGATRRRHKTSSPEEDSSSSEDFESPQDRPHRHVREPRDPRDPRPPSKKPKGDQSYGRSK